eukprot:TRINITY_DN23183_c0_g1_i1.p1 TRINITY_DN23183_c0_g1~~TRINITY_DN23183_c0_g1_i1.p1  ORF type:complete len:523 (+),score=69.17 TRINITY_DN23183_c0_g1_i1:35-1603(+)
MAFEGSPPSNMVGLVVAVFFLQAVSVSSCLYQFPGCSAENCTALDATGLSDSTHGVYGAYFQNGVTKTKSGYGNMGASQTGLANLGCFKLPDGYTDNSVKVNTLNSIASEKNAVADKDGLYYVAFLGKFNRVSQCCNACHATNGCSFWRYTPYPVLPHGLCYWIQTNLTTLYKKTEIYSTILRKGVTTYTEIGHKQYSATTSNPVPKMAAMKRSNKDGTYTCQVPLSISGGSCRNLITSAAKDPPSLGVVTTKSELNGKLARSFCVLTDKSLHVNMLVDGYLDERAEGASAFKDGKAVRSWIKELGVVYVSNGEEFKLHMVARKGKEQTRGDEGFLSAINFGGEPMRLPKVGEFLDLSDGTTLTFVAEEKMGTFDVDAYSLVIQGLGEISIKMRAAHPLLQTREDAQVHFNIEFNNLEVTPEVHGILGQTYREGSVREERAVKYSTIDRLLAQNVRAGDERPLEGDRDDYISSHVIATDCVFSSFKSPQNALQFVAMATSRDDDADVVDLAHASGDGLMNEL